MNIEQLISEGKIHLKQQNYLSAVECFRTVLSIAPDNSEVILDLGIALSNSSHFPEALPYFEMANRQLNSQNSNLNLGICYNCVTRFADAETVLRRSLEINPDDPIANYELSFSLLGQQNYIEAWKQIRWRRTTAFWPNPNKDPFPDKPTWQGERLADDQTLAIFQEQGLGDTLMLARLIPLVRERAKNIIFIVPAALQDILETSFSTPTFVNGESSSGADVQCTLFDLLEIFQISAHSIPQSQYLFADPQKVVQWQERLSGLPLQPNIGLVWAGEPKRHEKQMERDSRRSLPFDMFRPLFDAVGNRVNFIAVQTGDAIWQSRTSDLPIHDWTDDLTSFGETAGLMANLDLLISVDTSPVHLAGGMGIPFWLVNRMDTCWRWEPENHTPWYRTMREFRQTTWGDWTSVMDRISTALDDWRSRYPRLE